ncbi:MAG: cytochrome c3 family protein [Candidatus Aminicenantales bacterium]
MDTRMFKISRKKIAAILAISAGAVGILILVGMRLFGSRIRQPVAFNHRVHTENDMACEDCHFYFSQHAFSGRPALEVCAQCHEEALGKSREEKKVVDFIASGQEIDWQRIFRLPEDVYFSHRRHVKSGEVSCETCHGDIGQTETPPPRPLKKMTMKTCMGCHEKQDASNDCISCHR